MEKTQLTYKAVYETYKEDLSKKSSNELQEKWKKQFGVTLEESCKELWD